MTCGVAIAAVTYRKNSRDRASERIESNSKFYLDQCIECLSDLWDCYSKEKLNEIEASKVSSIITSYSKLSEHIKSDAHRHVINLKENHYKTLIANRISKPELEYLTGFTCADFSVGSCYDTSYGVIKDIIKVSELTRKIEYPIRISNEFYGKLVYLNGVSRDFFEFTISFIENIPVTEVSNTFKYKQRGLKSIRRKYPVFMAAYRYLFNIELGSETIELELPFHIQLAANPRPNGCI